MNGVSLTLSAASNLARILCGILLEQSERNHNAHTHTYVCTAQSSTRAPKCSALGVCVQEMRRQKKPAQSLIADCIQEHRCTWAPVWGTFFFPPVTAFSFTYLPAPLPELGLKNGVGAEMHQPRTEWEGGGGGEAIPPGGHRGELWLCSGLPKPVGGRRGQKIHCSKAMVEGER